VPIELMFFQHRCAQWAELITGVMPFPFFELVDIELFVFVG